MENDIKINRCGKLVTAGSESEMPYLHELHEQGLINGVDLKLISREEAVEREPTLRGAGDQVIYSPTTSVMDIH